LFRILVFAAAAIMLISAIMPWWTAHLEATAEEVIRQFGDATFTVELYQHGIPDNPAGEYFRADITPSYQVILAWIYMGVSVGLIALSAFLKGKKGRWLLGAAGLIYIAYAAIALIEITIRTGDYGVLVQGQITSADGYTVTTGFHIGYYLAYVSGTACLILALLRDKILMQRTSG
jgi:archaellum biogenesis protein FlaJ (TadC family)